MIVRIAGLDLFESGWLANTFLRIEAFLFKIKNKNSLIFTFMVECVCPSDPHYNRANLLKACGVGVSCVSKTDS